MNRVAERVDTTLLRLPAWRVPSRLDPADRRSPWWTWLVTRAFMLLVVGFAQQNVVGDVTYYGRSLYAMFRHGLPLRETLQEYPLPVFGVLLPQFLAGGLNPLAFAVLFFLSMLAVDALFFRHLLRTRAALRPEQVGTAGAIGFWIWFVPLMGPIAYFRFDLVPAVLAGAAVISVVTRPARSGWMTAAGAGLKLWPAALLPSFLVRREGRRRAFLGFLAGGVVVLGVSVLVGGFARLVSPLQWQSDRGLQIESIFALPLVVARVFSPDTWTVKVSPYKAWEVFGGGAHALVLASTVATGLTVVWLVWTWARAFRLREVPIELVGWLVFATVAVMTVVNKTLSPQYLIWLGGPLAAMMLSRRPDPALRRVAVLLLVIAGLTQLIFPLAYTWLLGDSPWQLPIATLLLVVRNVLLVVVTWTACRTVWTMTRAVAATSGDAADGTGETGDRPRSFAVSNLRGVAGDEHDDDDAQSLSSTA
ncbi:glycosyltransferase 87 family protein [Jatrophihabitans sp. YIM 134969]